MTLNVSEILQFLVLPLFGWLTWEIRNLRKEIELTRLDLADRIHVKECNRRMSDLQDRVRDLEKGEIGPFRPASNNPTITREI